MTAFIQSVGSLEPFAFTLADTNPRTIKASDNATKFQIESVIAAASGTATFRLWVDIGGGTEVDIIPGEALTAGDMFLLNGHPLLLKPGWTLKCSATLGGVVDVTASLLMISKNLDKQATL